MNQEGALHNDAVNVWNRRISRWLTHFIYWFSGNWLWIITGAIAAFYVGLPLLAPALMHAGHTGWAKVIYTVFRPLCHQMPERSFFLFGPQLTYTYEELQTAHHAAEMLPPRWIGNADVGFKTAVCQRDVAIYAVLTLSGALFYPLRRVVKPLTVRWFAAMLVPIAVDGFGQLFGLWTSTPWSRVITGGLFGLAAVWLAYPYMEKGMVEVHADSATALAEMTQRHTQEA